MSQESPKFVTETINNPVAHSSLTSTLPEGVAIDIVFYVMAEDGTRIRYVVTECWAPTGVTVSQAAAEKMLELSNTLHPDMKFRPMTRAEIVEFLKELADDE